VLVSPEASPEVSALASTFGDALVVGDGAAGFDFTSTAAAALERPATRVRTISTQVDSPKDSPNDFSPAADGLALSAFQPAPMRVSLSSMVGALEDRRLSSFLWYNVAAKSRKPGCKAMTKPSLISNHSGNHEPKTRSRRDSHTEKRAQMSQ